MVVEQESDYNRRMDDGQSTCTGCEMYRPSHLDENNEAGFGNACVFDLACRMDFFVATSGPISPSDVITIHQPFSPSTPSCPCLPIYLRNILNCTPVGYSPQGCSSSTPAGARPGVSTSSRCTCTCDTTMPGTKPPPPGDRTQQSVKHRERKTTGGASRVRIKGTSALVGTVLQVLSPAPG